MPETVERLSVETFSEIADHVGARFGPSDWIEVDQTLIDQFAVVTGDHAWFHIDVDRARRDMPDGLTIAHGLLTLSLTIRLLHGLIAIRRTSGRSFNYGYDRIRFLEPVQAGARIRLRGEVAGAERRPNGVRIQLHLTVEMEGSAKPALVADWIELSLP